MKKVLALFVASIILSCSSPTIEEENYANKENESQQVEHFIDLEDAKEISKNFYRSDGKKSSNFIAKEIEEHLVVNPDGENPTSYIMNYEGGGFIIVSADDRTIPILAYSEENKFPFDRNDTLPANLLNWLESTHTTIRKIRNDDIKIENRNPNERKQMSNYQTIATNGYGSFIGTPCFESEEGTQFWFTETYGPFTQTKWGQGVGYNDALDYAGCTQRSNGKPPVGFV